MQTFQELMIEWVRHFFVESKEQMPEFIILYREGLTEKQMDTQGRAEVEALNQIASRANERVQNYQPQIIYIMVVKRASKRVYRPERSSAGKFSPTIMKNPEPGTMVFESISSEDVFDFHLTAQNVTEGTATLNQYLIAYDASKIPEDAIAQFTLEQCHNYPNWQGGISVPSCLQSADRLSKLVGEHLHQNLAKSDIQFKPFYL